MARGAGLTRRAYRGEMDHRVQCGALPESVHHHTRVREASGVAMSSTAPDFSTFWQAAARKATACRDLDDANLSGRRTDVFQLFENLELDENVVIGRFRRQHGTVSNAAWDHHHVTFFENRCSHFGFPFQGTLDTEDDFMGVDVAMPERHVVLAALGDVDPQMGALEHRQRGAVALINVRGREFL